MARPAIMKHEDSRFDRRAPGRKGELVVDTRATYKQQSKRLKV
jgi:hypothetical protein